MSSRKILAATATLTLAGGVGAAGALTAGAAIPIDNQMWSADIGVLP